MVKEMPDIQELWLLITKLEISTKNLEKKFDILETRRIEQKKDFDQLKTTITKLIAILTGVGISTSFIIWFIDHYKDIKLIFQLWNV